MAIKYKRKEPEGGSEDALSLGRYGRGRPGTVPACRRHPRSVLLIGLAASLVVYAVGTVVGRLPSASEPPVNTCRGTVVSKESRDLEGGEPEYAFVVEVVAVDGGTYRDTVPVTQASWDAVASGAEVEVAYRLDEAKGLFRIVDLYAGHESSEGPGPPETAEALP
jgi:hypothetical protein